MTAMSHSRLFNLAHRVERPDPFESVDLCRDYDRDIRTSMLIPYQHMMKMVLPFCRPGARCLEVGAASGLLSLRLSALEPEAEFLALEGNDHFLQIFKENLIFANLLNFRGRLHYDWARPSRLPVEDASQDMVFSFCCINRWDNPAKGLAECARVCHPDGTVVLYDLARDAEEGLVSFILQYVGGHHADFMDALGSAFTVEEMRERLDDAGLTDWQVAREGVNMVISSRPLDTAYTVGSPAVFNVLGSRRRSDAA
jgi:SAM-dependent methyltransferase